MAEKKAAFRPKWLTGMLRRVRLGWKEFDCLFIILPKNASARLKLSPSLRSVCGGKWTELPPASDT
ncbi:hypothetical protein P7F60_19885 [Rhizobium sp. YJ-22]|uniref:hypothetical protein n=1 Tax=Rhizobium sp. YJ-22 TaxID=3037556 RepID=UPI001AC298E4|nr:hypothetical protein [Rhizobium sp. YJ-22]MBN9030417.1 hypothetical protein [Hyphomicrobiales bacterium]MDG3578656.1 hypothetical protein [Rhizobium sp. YJ-22]